MFIEVQAHGPASDVVAAFTALGNDARARGFRVYMDDPAALAGGDGRFGIELEDVEDKSDARAVVRALIDQVPGANNLFSIIEND